MKGLQILKLENNLNTNKVKLKKSNQQVIRGRWTEQENKLFEIKYIEFITKKISLKQLKSSIPGRTPLQIHSHIFKKKYNLEKKFSALEDEETMNKIVSLNKFFEEQNTQKNTDSLILLRDEIKGINFMISLENFVLFKKFFSCKQEIKLDFQSIQNFLHMKKVNIELKDFISNKSNEFQLKNKQDHNSKNNSENIELENANSNYSEIIKSDSEKVTDNQDSNILNKPYSFVQSVKSTGLDTISNEQDLKSSKKYILLNKKTKETSFFEDNYKSMKDKIKEKKIEKIKKNIIQQFSNQSFHSFEESSDLENNTFTPFIPVENAKLNNSTLIKSNSSSSENYSDDAKYYEEYLDEDKNSFSNNKLFSELIKTFNKDSNNNTNVYSQFNFNNNHQHNFINNLDYDVSNEKFSLKLNNNFFN